MGAGNCEGMFIVQQPPGAQNHSVGHIGLHAVRQDHLAASQPTTSCVPDSADLGVWLWSRQMLFNRGLIDYSWPSVPTPTASQSSLCFCPFWRADGLTDGHWCREGEITSLDTHVEPRSLFEAQLRNRRQGQAVAGGGAPRL